MKIALGSGSPWGQDWFGVRTALGPGLVWGQDSFGVRIALGSGLLWVPFSDLHRSLDVETEPWHSKDPL